jgi:hypothetical protein
MNGRGYDQPPARPAWKSRSRFRHLQRGGPNDRAELEGWRRSPSLRAGLAQRARIVPAGGR